MGQELKTRDVHLNKPLRQPRRRSRVACHLPRMSVNKKRSEPGGGGTAMALLGSRKAFLLIHRNDQG
uniref:Uncharacterized protein n=1 Tax=Macrostomum lignano TaxID=282301 RepID=A0A1I8FMU2_9PLAT